MKRLFLIFTLVLFASGAFAQTPLYPSRYTVATLPAASTLTNKIVLVTDSTSTGDCTVGGGLARTLCQSTGSAWIPAGDGTGAGGTLTSVSGTPPINSSGGSTPAISIDTADATHIGALSATDWNTFNNKQPALGYTPANIALSNLSGVGANVSLGGSTKLNFGTNGSFEYSNGFGPKFRDLSTASFTIDIQLSAGRTWAVPNTDDTFVGLSSLQSLTNKKLGSLTSNGFVKTSGGDGTLSVDTNTYLTGNQTITLSGDVSGSGATTIATTIGAGKVISSMLNITTSTCVNQFLTAISATGIGTCTTATLAGPQFANQGTTTTLLHGNASGNPAFSQIVNADITNSTIDLTAKVTGVLPSANGGTGVNNAGTFTNASNTTITGGGTISLGGFTFTVPATGTAVETSRTITEGNGLAGNTYDLSANRTLALGTPSTLTVSTANSASGTTHSHAITSSSNPGAAASILATDASGNFTNARHTVTDYLFVNNATANLYLKDTSTGFQSATTLIVTPQANNAFRSTSYTSGLVGWSINATGSAEFDNVDVRGAIHAGIFTYNAINVTAGTQLITPSGAKLKSDVTVTAAPTYGTTTFTVDAVDQDGLTHAASQLFVVNDILRLKDGLVGDTWFKVTAVSDQTTFWRYTASIQAGSNNVTYRAGQGIPDYGISGKGGIMLTADQTNSPYLQMFTHAATFSSADASGSLTLTPQLRLGNLNGSYGYASDVYGLGAGQYGAASKSWITVEQTNGFRIGNNTTTLASWSTAGVITVGQVAASQSNIIITSSALALRSNTTEFIRLNVDGSGHVANSLFAWDTSGNVTITGNAVIGGVTIGNGKMYIGTGTYNNTNTSFYVDSTGQMSLKDKFVWSGSALTINGTVTATAGTIGGWTLGATSLSAGSGATTVAMDSGGTNPAFYAGSATPGSAPFRVTNAGLLTTTSASIGAWTVNSTAIQNSGATVMMRGAGNLAFGNPTPPTSATVGTGLFISDAGMVGLLSNVVQAKFDATTGGITAGAGNAILDVNGLTLLQGASTGNKVKWTTSGEDIFDIFGQRQGSPLGSTATILVSARAADTAAAHYLNLAVSSKASSPANDPSINLVAYDSAHPTLANNQFIDITARNGVLIAASGTLTIPNAMLDVRGTMRGSSTLTLDPMTVGSVFYSGASGLVSQDNSNFFWDGANHRLGIGTTTPGTLLEVKGATSGGITTRLNNTTSTGYSGVEVYEGATLDFYFVSLNSGSGATGGPGAVQIWNFQNAPTIFATNNTVRLTLSAAGAVRFHTYGVGTITSDASGNLTSVSDLTVKKDIRPFTRGLNALIGLKPILYGYTKESGLDQTKDDYVGYGAQNVQEFIPEAVGHDASGKLTLWDRPILDTAINSILELNTRIKALEAKVADLEKRKN